MTKATKAKKSILATALIVLLAVTAIFLTYTGNTPVGTSLPVLGAEVTMADKPVMPAAGQINYTYTITGAGNELTVERDGTVGAEITATTVAAIGTALDAQNGGKITKLIFGEGISGTGDSAVEDVVELGENTLVLGAGTYIIEGAVSGGNTFNDLGVINFANNASAYINARIKHTAPINSAAAHGIYFNSTGELNIMTGTDILAATAVTTAIEGATVNVEGGLLAGSGGVTLSQPATLNIFGGTVKGTAASGTFFAIRADNESTINVLGGTLLTTGNVRTISINTPAAAATTGTLNIKGGSITAEGANVAYAVYAGKATVNMTGGEVISKSGSMGYGIHLQTAGAVLNMSGGSVVATSAATAIQVFAATATANITNGLVKSVTGKGINGVNATSVINISGANAVVDGDGEYVSGTLISSGSTQTTDGAVATGANNTVTGLTITGGTFENTVETATTNSANSSVIYISSTTNVDITGGEFKGINGKTIHIYSASAATAATVNISGGTFSTVSGATILNHAAGTVNLTGGTVSATTGIAIRNNATGIINIKETVAITSANNDVAQGTVLMVAATGTLNALGGSINNTNGGKIVNNTIKATVVLSIAWPADTYVYNKNAITVTPSTATTIGTTTTVTAKDNVKTLPGRYLATVETVTAQGMDNYTIENSTFAYEITAIELGVTWKNFATRAYNGQPSNLDINLDRTNLVGADTVTYQIIGGTETNAGTYTAKVLLSDPGYTLGGDATQEYTIEALGLKIYWLNCETRAYDANPSNVVASLEKLNVLPFEDVNLTLKNGDLASAGTHQAVATIDNPNYYIENPTQEYTISPKAITVTWGTPTAFPYDGQLHIPTLTYAGAIQGDDVTVTATGAKSAVATSISPHTATAVLGGTSAGNYTLNTPTRTFTISAVAVNATHIAWSNTELVYNGTAQVPTAVITNAVAGETVIGVVTGAQINVNATGTQYTATISSLSGPTASNYSLTTSTHTFTIIPKEIGITWGNTAFEYNKTEQAPTATVTGLIGSDVVDVTVTGGETSANNAGTPFYTATATALTGEDSSNYCVPAIGATQSFTISQRRVEIAWTNTNLTYNGNVQTPTATVSSGLLAGDIISVFLMGGQVNAGEYTAIAVALTGLGATNYYMTPGVTRTFTISKVEIGITWSNTSLVYNGLAQAPTATPTGVIAGDNIAITVSGAEINANANPYTASATAITGQGAANYSLPTNHEESFTIAMREVVILWNGIDGLVYDGNQKDVSAIAINAVAGDIVTITVTGGDETNAGTHTATATALNNNNYCLPVTATVDYSIAKKEIGILWSGYSNLVYSGNAQNVRAIATGIIGSDTVNVTVTDGNKSAAGTYTATATALSNTNYCLPLSGTKLEYTIAKKELTVAWAGNTGLVYDGNAKDVHVEVVGGLIGSDEVEIDITDGGMTDAGTYIAIASLSDNNYCLPNAGSSIEYTIAKRVVGVSWDYTGIVSGGTKNVTATATGVISGDTVTVTVSGGAETAVGSYTATASALGGADAANYALPNGATQKYAVAKAVGGAAPTVESSNTTSSSITVKTVSGAEYSRDGITWQDGATFEGLDAGTTYTIYCRIKATETTEASAIGKADIATDGSKASGCGSISFSSEAWLGMILILSAISISLFFFLKRKNPSKAN